MRKLIEIGQTIGRVLNVISIIALLVMIFITIADVLLREFFLAPITGAVEITRMMMVCMAPSFVSALFFNRHVSVGLFVDKLHRGGQLTFDVVAYILSSVICGLMSYQGFVEMFKKMGQHQVYTMLKIPTWPFYLVFSISMGFFALAILVKLIGNIGDKELYTGHDTDSQKGGEGH